jgi:hypothetical protein
MLVVQHMLIGNVMLFFLLKLIIFLTPFLAIYYIVL